MPCNIILSKKDSLKGVSDIISKKLHKEILGSTFKYDYRELTIYFNCHKSKDSETSEFFEYKPEELN